MKAKFVIALVSRGMSEKVDVTCYLHEKAVLEQVHGAGNVVLEDGLPNEPLVEVVAAEEYNRLAMLYGNDPKTSLPYVERAFGIFDDAKFTADVEALLPAPVAPAAKAAK